MKYTDNVSNNQKLKKDLEQAISKKLKLDDLKDGFTYGVKVRISEVREFFKVSKTDVAKMLGCSPPVARAIMYRADFPLVRVGKALKVSKHAFEEWASKRQA